MQRRILSILASPKQHTSITIRGSISHFSPCVILFESLVFKPNLFLCLSELNRSPKNFKFVLVRKIIYAFYSAFPDFNVLINFVYVMLNCNSFPSVTLEFYLYPR